MAKKKVIDKTTPVKDAIIEETPVVEDVTDNTEVEVSEKEIIAEDEPIVEDVIDKTDKKVCRVILATPTYYVIAKDGKSIAIHKKNNYRRGDEILA